MDSLWHDQVKKDGSLQSSIKAFSHSFMSLSITQWEKKVTEQAKIFCLMSPSASHQGRGEPKNQILNFWLYNGPANVPPVFLSFVPPPPSFTEATERHDGLYSFISVLLLWRAGRPAAGSQFSLFWSPVPSFLLGKGSFVWNGSHAVSDARVIPGPTLSSAGFHKSRAAAANGSGSDNNRERHILKTLEHSGHNCVAIVRVNMGDHRHIILWWQKANLSHPNTPNNHQRLVFKA